MTHRLAPVGTAILVALTIGFAAASLRDTSFWLTFIVFAVCTAPPGWILGWVLFSPDARKGDAVGEGPDNIEFSWSQRAGNRAFFDLVTVTGLVGLLVSIGDFEPPTGIILACLTIFGLSDFALRLTLLRRQET